MRNKTCEANSWITRPINSTRKKKKQTVRHDLLRFVLKLHQLQVTVYSLIYGISIFFQFLFTLGRATSRDSFSAHGYNSLFSTAATYYKQSEQCCYSIIINHRVGKYKYILKGSES